MGIQPAANPVLGAFLAMEDPTEIDLDLMFPLESQRDHSFTRGLRVLI